MIIVNYAKKEQSAVIKDLMIAANSEAYSRYRGVECLSINEGTEKVAQEVDLEDSPYSYKNILVAMNGDDIAGIAVSFEGEGTLAGELILDCLTVHPLFRHKSVARRLLAATKERAGKLKLPRVGMLIDEDDAYGEAFCSTVGFSCAEAIQEDDCPKKHLICDVCITYPMNAMQKEMYEDWNQDRTMTQYNTTVAVDMPRENVAMGRVIRACQLVLDGQRYLHSHLAMENGEVVVSEDWSMPNYVFRYDTTDAEWDAKKEELIKPFNLFDEAAVRLHVVGTETRTILIVETDHILFDGISHKAVHFAIMAQLQGEMLYPQGNLAEKFNREELSNYNGPAYNKAKEYYAAEIGKLKFTDICKKTDSPWGKTIVARPHVPARPIDEGCKRLNVSFAVVFYAAYALALADMSGEQKVLFCTVTHGRANKKLTNRVYGNFLSCLPIIIDTKPDQTIMALLEQTKTQLFTSMRNRAYPLYHMQHDLNLVDVGTELSPQGLYIYEFVTVDDVEYPTYHIETDKSKQHLSTCILLRGDEYEMATDASAALYTQEQLDTLARLIGEYATKLTTTDEKESVGSLH